MYRMYFHQNHSIDQLHLKSDRTNLNIIPYTLQYTEFYSTKHIETLSVFIRFNVINCFKRVFKFKNISKKKKTILNFILFTTN